MRQARLVADALSHQRDEVADIVGLYALVLGIIATYQGPNLALHEMHEYVRQGRINYLVEFGEAAAPTWRAVEPEVSAPDAAGV